MGIEKAMKTSMGQDIVEMDMQNIDHFALEVVKLADMRKSLHEYLKTKMDLVAPNLSALIGEIIGARLISHAGSLINLAQQKNKGRISRYLANKCSIASRIDCFSDEATTVFGEKLEDQVEERLTFLTEGTTPRKNLEVMQEAMKEVQKKLRKKKKKSEAKVAASAEGAELTEKKKKRKASEAAEAAEEKPK